MKKIIFAMMAAISVFACGFGTSVSAQTFNALVDTGAVSDFKTYTPVASGGGTLLLWTCEEASGTNITVSYQIDTGTDVLTTSEQEYNFSEASLMHPVVARVRQKLEYPIAGGPSGAKYSDWSEWIALPYDSSLDISVLESPDWFIDCYADGSVKIFPFADFGDSVACIFGDHSFLGQFPSSYSFVASADSFYSVFRLALCSDSGFSSFFSSRTAFYPTEFSLDLPGQELILDPPDLFAAYPDATSVLIQVYCPGSTFLCSESLDDTSVSVSVALPETIDAVNVGDTFLVTLTVQDASSLHKSCVCYYPLLTITQDMLDTPDPVDPSAPETPEDGGNLFAQIDALGEPWNILIYIAGGCLIVMALGALFGRR